MSPKPSHDPSIEHEPHLRGQGETQGHPPGDDERVEHSVWDEPASQGSTAPPPGALTYAGWLESRIVATGPLHSWGVTMLTAAVAGPLAILGAMISSRSVGIVGMVFVAPVLEEIAKVAAALWIVEKRPFLFRSRLQIATCVLASGLVFASIENLLYLHVYVLEPTAGLIRWRWTVCVALHMGCSVVAGMGLMQIWTRTMTQRTRPRLIDGAPLLAAAAVIHGIYNAFAVVLESMDFRF